MEYLLDTNICIYLIKKRPFGVLKRFKQHSPQDVAISIITVFELEYGVHKSLYPLKSQEALAKFLGPLHVLTLNRASVTESASIRAKLEKSGRPIGAYDLLIAGQARALNMTLVTNTTREFERINGLIVANWVV